jgi:hypothetical protein
VSFGWASVARGNRRLTRRSHRAPAHRSGTRCQWLASHDRPDGLTRGTGPARRLVRDLRDLEHVIVDSQACRLRGVTGLLDPGLAGASFQASATWTVRNQLRRSHQQLAVPSTPITATAVVHLMIRSAAIIGHRRQAQTRRSRGMGVGFWCSPPSDTYRDL